jgi:hypothetical protein
MASPQAGLRQRNVPASSKKKSAAASDSETDSLAKVNKKKAAPTNNSDWDYKIAFSIITALAFVSRFWGINHPNEVVFDEVHFGKVSSADLRGSSMVDGRALTLTRVSLLLVRLLLSREDLLLRRPSTLWQAPVRLDGLARWLRWPFSL